MLLKVKNSCPSGAVKIPGSKSHTIRAVCFASLAEGTSTIRSPLLSADTESAIKACEVLGAEILRDDEILKIRGFAGVPQPRGSIIDVGNSGTTLRIASAMAALASQPVAFTGDRQIQTRPMAPLAEALEPLGAEMVFAKDNGMAPFTIKGPLKGGGTSVEAVTSQFLSALLMTVPLCPAETEITVYNLNEKPYVDLTLWWLDRLGIQYEKREDYGFFRIPGGQFYRSFERAVPGDFSSATFFMVQAAVSGGEFMLENLDCSDPQGDKVVLDYLSNMGAAVEAVAGSVRVRGKALKGIEIDMNATPDALPAMAVAGCFAEGETVLKNVPQARLKETDRIKTMCAELKKMGADIRELPDGLVIRKSRLHAASLCGHDDHRLVMALSLAGLNTEGETVIDTAESVRITFPDYVEKMKQCGAEMAYA